MKASHPNLDALIFNRPLMIHRPKLHAIIRALGSRIRADSFTYDDEDDDEGLNSPAGNPDDDMAEGISVIRAYGTLVKRCVGLDAMSGLTSYESLSAEIMEAATDPECKAILLDVDSYGGECAGAFDLSDLIYQVRQSIPVYGIANCHAYSAGYALASACEKLWVTQDGGIGSIGVIAEHCDESELNAKIGLKYTAITFGSHKNDFSPNSPLSDDALAEIQADVDRFGAMFVALVARNRGMSADAVLATQAAVYGAKDGIATGLADQIGTRADAMSALQSRIGKRKLIPMPGQAFSVASASAAAIPPKENVMQSTTEADANRGTPPDLDAIRKEATDAAKASAAASVSQINALCLIAGAKELVGDFIAQGLTPAQVSEKLIERKIKAEADALQGKDLNTEFLPQGQAGKDAMNNPNRLMDAVKRRIKGREGVRS